MRPRDVNAPLHRLLRHAGLCWVAGSTHAPEETIVLTAFAKLRGEFPALQLILVPRHPDRFDEVAKLIEQTGISVIRRSRITSVQRSNVRARSPAKADDRGTGADAHISGDGAADGASHRRPGQDCKGPQISTEVSLGLSEGRSSERQENGETDNRQYTEAFGHHSELPEFV